MSRSLNFKALEQMDEGEVLDLVNQQDDTGSAPLHLAIRARNVNDVLSLLMFKADCSIADQSGNIPLHLAAECGNLEILNLVAEATDDLDAGNVDGETPVLLAAHAGHIGAVVALTSMDKHVVPADTSIVDLHGRTILMHACISGDMDLVRLLILNKDGVSQKTSIARVAINAVDNDGVSALMYASMEGHWSLVSILVISGANVAIKDNAGRTALHWAASQGTPSTVSALFDCGAYLNEQDCEQWTPLMHAVNENSIEMVQLLVDMGASPDHALGIAKSHAVHLMLCDAIRRQVVDPWLRPRTVTGRLVISLLNAVDLYIDPAAVANGKSDIHVYGVIQFKTNGDPDDAEMIAVTPAIRLPPLKEQQKPILEWNEVVTFFLKRKTVYPDAILMVELFATRDLSSIGDLLNMQHAAGEDTGGVEPSHSKKRERMDTMYKEIQSFEKAQYAKRGSSITTATISELRKRWTNLAEQRKRFEKFYNQHIPLPPVPLTHLPCGSITLTQARLREVFRGGQMISLTKYPRGSDRGQVRFDVDFVPSIVDFRDHQVAVYEIPRTPKQSELPRIKLPPELLLQNPEDADRFAPRVKKFYDQCKERYAKYWTRFDKNDEEIVKQVAETPQQYDKRALATITVIAQAMMRD
jgi:ankyrin repeat protein